MTKQSKAARKKVSKKASSVPKQKDSAAVQALLDLRQPWNPVVRAAIDLLRDDRESERNTIVDYAYGDRVYGNGAWSGEHVPPQFRVSSIGIVLQGRVEVVLEQNISAKGRSTCSPVRPRPYAVLKPGNVIGSFEYIDRLVGVPTKYGYTLLAGPASVQVVHPAFSAFEYTDVIRKTLKAELDRHQDCSKRLVFFEKWKQSGESYNLIRSFADFGDLETSHARVLLILLNLVSGSAVEESLRNTVVEAGWLQSALARRSLFPALTRTRLNLSKKSVAGVADTIHALVRRAEAVLHDGGLVWAPLTRTNEYFRSLTSFLNVFSRPDVDKTVAVAKQHICVAAPLSSCLDQGFLSIADDILEVECNDGTIGENLVDDLLDRWRANAIRGKGSALQEITHVLKGHYGQETYRTDENAAVTVRSLEESDWWQSPLNDRAMPRNVPAFERLVLQIDAGFPDLRVLSLIDEKLRPDSKNWNDTLIVGCQHLLTETGCWFQHLLKGASKPAIIVGGKHYSTSPAVVERLSNIGINVVEESEWKWTPGEYQDTMERKSALVWKMVSQQLIERPRISKIVIVDDGGFLISSVPSTLMDHYRIVAVEQTQSGIERLKAAGKEKKMPLVINVAESPLKKGIESPMIARAVWAKAMHFCESLRSPKGTKFGVIGLGFVGRAVLDHLEEMELQVCWFDREQNKAATGFKPLQQLLRDSDVIFGCSGTDVIPTKYIDTCAGKTLISCSSTDAEFRTLLRDERGRREIEHDPFATILINVDGKLIRILNGGFPANFDRNAESVPLNEIQLTRALMHGGLIEALQAANSSSRNRKASIEDLTMETQHVVAMALLDVNFPTNLHKLIKDFVGGRLLTRK